MDSNKYKYPTRFEIEQAFGFCKRRFLNEFAQSRGIFISKVIQEELSQILSGFFFEHSDIEEIRKAAFRATSKNTLSGFILESKDIKFDLVSFFDEQKNNSDFKNDGITFSPIVKDHYENGNPSAFQGKINYITHRPGRIEFLHEEKRSFDYFIKEIDRGHWQVLIDCNKSNDTKVLENIIKKKARSEIKMTMIKEEMLTSKQTISFFDRLAKLGIEKEWDFKEVKKLMFKKPRADEEETVEKTELAGITQAILEGNDLRENPFVKQSEKSGYRFTAMTYEYENRKRPFIIQIHAEFKGRPKVFEVSLIWLGSREGINGEIKNSSLSAIEDKQIRTDFWLKAKEVYDSLIKKVPLKTGKHSASPVL